MGSCRPDVARAYDADFCAFHRYDPSLEEGVSWLEKSRAHGPHHFLGYLGLAYVRAGRRSDAERLMAEVEVRLRAKGCRKAYLLVKKGNPAAVALYENLGWGEMDQVQLFGKAF